MEFFKHPRDTGTRIGWPGGRPRDAVGPPQEPAVLKILDTYRFGVRIGHNCYEIVNSQGDVVELPFGEGRLEDWESACAELEQRCGR